jgi:membrane-associated PAP2 superfamily phosphatase
LGRSAAPAAHPLSSFAWLAVGFALYPLAPRRAKQWWSVAFALGTLFGAVQVARGAHFPSHVFWSAWVTWAVNIGLLRASRWLPSASSAQRSTLRSDIAALR